MAVLTYTDDRLSLSQLRYKLFIQDIQGTELLTDLGIDGRNNVETMRRALISTNKNLRR